MFFKKMIMTFSIMAFIGTSLYAKQQDPDMVSYKDYKEKKATTNSAKKAINEKKVVTSTKKEEKEKYQKLLRDGRIELTKQGIYDASMMTVLKKARCTVERTNFECSLGGE